jgi:hypothetical protein
MPAFSNACLIFSQRLMGWLALLILEIAQGLQGYPPRLASSCCPIPSNALAALHVFGVIGAGGALTSLSSIAIRIMMQCDVDLLHARTISQYQTVLFANVIQHLADIGSLDAFDRRVSQPRES